MSPTLRTKLHPHHVQTIVISLQDKPFSAIHFFEWAAQKYLNSPHIAQSFYALLNLLLSKQLFGPATLVFDKFSAQFGNDRDHGFSWKNNGILYEFLIENYSRTGMVDMLVKLFKYVRNEGVFVSPNVWFVFLGSLVDFHRIDVILENYGELCLLVKGNQLNVYEFAINRLINKVEVEVAFNFHKAMLERNWKPDTIA